MALHKHTSEEREEIKKKNRLSGKELRKHLKRLKGERLSPLAEAVKEQHGK